MPLNSDDLQEIRKTVRGYAVYGCVVMALWVCMIMAVVLAYDPGSPFVR